MKFGLARLALLPLFDVDPGGSPTPPAAPSQPTPPVSQPATPPASGQPAVPAAQPQAQPPAGFTYKEDRSNWVPSHVVRQNTERLREYERDLLIERQRVAALSGVKPPQAPRNPEHDQIRNQLFEVAPEMKELFELKDKLKELTGLDLGQIKQLQAGQEQVWQQQGAQTLRTLADKVKAVYGNADLPAKQIARIQRAFAEEVREDPNMRARYEAGDPTLIDEFVKDFTGGILDPYRRTTQAAAQPGFEAARRLPRGGGSSAIVGARPATLKPGDPDFHKAAFGRFSRGQ
jgi:hypothetical protein